MLAITALLAVNVPQAGAQEMAGQIVDSQNGAPVGLAAIILLDSDRNPLVQGAADEDGRYIVQLPSPGEYYLIVERLGYFETESPLLAVEAVRRYAVDLEMRPEPFKLDPLEVTVTNEKLEDFLTLSFGQHPASLPGYRSIQGLRLEQVKLKARDNTDLLRWLYIPVSHGARVCVGTFGGPGLPSRTSAERTNAAAGLEGSGQWTASGGVATAQRQCGALYVDGYRCRNELIEEIEMSRIAVVVTLRGAVHLYTRDFDWSYRPGGGAPAC